MQRKLTSSFSDTQIQICTAELKMLWNCWVIRWHGELGAYTRPGNCRRVQVALWVLHNNKRVTIFGVGNVFHCHGLWERFLRITCWLCENTFREEKNTFFWKPQIWGPLTNPYTDWECLQSLLRTIWCQYFYNNKHSYCLFNVSPQVLELTLMQTLFMVSEWTLTFNIQLLPASRGKGNIKSFCPAMKLASGERLKENGRSCRMRRQREVGRNEKWSQHLRSTEIIRTVGEKCEGNWNPKRKMELKRQQFSVVTMSCLNFQTTIHYVLEVWPSPGSLCSSLFFCWQVSEHRVCVPCVQACVRNSVEEKSEEPDRVWK